MASGAAAAIGSGHAHLTKLHSLPLDVSLLCGWHSKASLPLSVQALLGSYS